MEQFNRIGKCILIFLVTLLLFKGDAIPGHDQRERIRFFTRSIEFDYASWTLDAIKLKWLYGTLNAPAYFSPEQQRQIVYDYIEAQIDYTIIGWQIDDVYMDPTVFDPDYEARGLLQEQTRRRNRLEELAPLCEAVIQYQITSILKEQGLTLAGQPIPPILYRVTPLPFGMVISPRNVIRQDHFISLQPDMPLDQINRLEQSVEADQNVSALITPVGGIGAYPTMVSSTSNLPWLLEVVSHEWIHNYLTLRPLGWNYDASPELRTMNETTAEIAGIELGHEIVARYYPELLPPPPAPTAQPTTQPTPDPDQPPPFDFNHEMYITRLTTDQLLSEGKIEEAESYMESRRQFLRQHGYFIRRLNQAYFAFHGAYAPQAGSGAQGSDPVGPTVNELRQQSPNLATFLNRISWMTSFDQLQKAVKP
ncbi:MAG: hypothetical protein LDL12_00480 [Anaerolinea sp.]|nr:hypothetical protein [Anaerolinea sp.]